VASGYGWPDSLRVFTDQGKLNVEGPFDIRVRKPYHADATIRNVRPPENRCGIIAPMSVNVTLRLDADAPHVRQVVVPHFQFSFGDGNIGEQLQAYVEADPGYAQTTVWLSRDTTVATITPGGSLRSACRTRDGSTFVVASATADPSVTDSVKVLVSALHPTSGRCPVT
jgi:hypothetical protein